MTSTISPAQKTFRWPRCPITDWNVMRKIILYSEGGLCRDLRKFPLRGLVVASSRFPMSRLLDKDVLPVDIGSEQTRSY